MTTGEKIKHYRLQSDYTLAYVADLLEVSESVVGDWETNRLQVEPDKLNRLSTMFGITMDELNSDIEVEENTKTTSISFYNEYISDKKLFGIPLYHIIIGKSMKQAKGIIAVGFRSKGFLSLGMISTGVFSIGFLSFGLFSAGLLSIGLLALGTFSIGFLAVGGASLGVISLGGLSIGLFSFGGLAIGKYLAFGDHATGMIAVGMQYANGTLYEMASQTERFIYDKITITETLRTHTPVLFRFIVEFIIRFL